MPVVTIGSELTSENFDWELYESEVYDKIIHAEEPVHVIWDLSGMNTVPPMTIIIKQIHLLTTEKERINTNIHHNTIIVNSSKIETFLNFVFDNLYTPQNPVNILMK
jgi:hypothetical protein